MGLNIIRETEDYCHIALDGRLDAAGVETLELEFMANTTARKKNALIDCAQVTFIASMGIRMLIAAAQTLQHAGTKMILIAPQPLVKNALEIAGLAPILPIAPDAMEAIAMLANE